MPVTADQKPRRFDVHPRLKRAKPKPATLDDNELHLVLPEKQYRELLFRDFVRFCREHGGFVVSVPWQSPVTVQVRLADGEPSRLEIALQQLPKYRVVKLPSTAARLSHGIFETM